MDAGKPGRQREDSADVVDSAAQAEEERLKRARLRLIGLGLQFGSTIVGSLVLFLLGGIWLDRQLGTQPLFLLVGMVLAFVAIGYNLYELAAVKVGSGKPKAPPSGTSPVARRQSADAWDDEKEEEDDWPARPRADSQGKEG